MTFDINKLKATLQSELDSLAKSAEELRLQGTLLQADARAEWDRLEHKLRAAQEEVNRVTEHAKAPLHEIESASRKLFLELKHGFERIRQSIKG
jgi:predicted  nucleic acid-binding Zn-ribbon protein